MLLGHGRALLALLVVLALGTGHLQRVGAVPAPAVPSRRLRAHRTLAQAPEGTGDVGAAASTPADAPSGSAAALPPPPASRASATAGTVIDTLVDQKCSLMQRALLAGRQLVAAADNLQPDAISCCQSCLGRQGCTAWVYCPQQGGCSVPSTNATLEAAAEVAGAAGLEQLRASYKGCRLLSIPAFKLQKDSPEIVAKGQDVPFISGTPVMINLPVLPSYSVRPGTDTARGLGYSCRESLVLSSCMVQGKVEEVAAICDADPLCLAFVYLPKGVDSLSEQPMAILKGGSELKTLPIAALKPNPNTALYIKASVPTTTENWDHEAAIALECGGAVAANSCSRSPVLWIVLPTLLAATLIAVAAVAVYATLALRQQAKYKEEAAAAAAAQAARRGKPPNSGGGGSSAGAGSSGSGATAQRGGPLPSCLTVSLVKSSPPHSGSSGHSGQSGSSTHSRSTSGTLSPVSCPQCGAVLSISAAGTARHRTRMPRTPQTPAQQAQQPGQLPVHQQQQYYTQAQQQYTLQQDPYPQQFPHQQQQQQQEGNRHQQQPQHQQQQQPGTAEAAAAAFLPPAAAVEAPSTGGRRPPPSPLPQADRLPPASLQ